MSILSQLIHSDYNEISEHTKLELFAEAYRMFNRSLYIHDEDPQIAKWAEVGEIKYNYLQWVFYELGIIKDFNESYEIDVTTALEEGITYKEAHDKRIFSFSRA